MKQSRHPRNPIIREKPVLMGFAVQRRGADGRIEIGIRWGRLFGSFLIILIVGWLGIAGALFLDLKLRRGYEKVSFIDVATVQKEKIRVEMGNFQIEKGLAAIKAGDFRSAISNLRLGVTRAPANLEGRKVLADIYEVALKRPDIAADIMVKGVNFGGIDDLDFLKAAFRLLLRNQMDESIQELADRYLPEESEMSMRNRTIAYGAANANYLRGNFDRADEYIITYKLTDSLEGILLSSNISWDRGNKFAAINKLEDSIEKFPNSEALLMQLSRYHREMGEYDTARRYAILRNIRDPLSPAPRIELLYIYNKTGDKEREEREIRRMLRQFRDDENALLSLANFAGDTGNVDLARRTYEEALENEHRIPAFALLLIESHLVSGDYDGALEFAEELVKERPSWLAEKKQIFSSLRAVASYGSGRPDLGEIYLQDFLEDYHDAKTYLAVARRFTNIGRDQQARRVLSDAYSVTPNNQLVISELIRIDLALGNTENLDRLLKRLLTLRRPQTELLAEAYQRLGSDLFIFTPDREGLLLELGAILREQNERIPVGANAGSS